MRQFFVAASLKPIRTHDVYGIKSRHTLSSIPADLAGWAQVVALSVVLNLLTSRRPLLIPWLIVEHFRRS